LEYIDVNFILRYLEKRCLVNIIIFHGTLKIGIIIGNPYLLILLGLQQLNLIFSFLILTLTIFSFILANTNPKTLTILYSSSLSTISTKYPNISPSHAPLYCFHHTLLFLFLSIQFLLLFPSFSRSQSFLPHPIHIFLSREQIAKFITSISSDTVF